MKELAANKRISPSLLAHLKKKKKDMGRPVQRTRGAHGKNNEPSSLQLVIERRLATDAEAKCIELPSARSTRVQTLNKLLRRSQKK